MSPARAFLLVAAALLAAAALASASATAPPEVSISSGKLRGNWSKTQRSGRDIAAFEGVPFAEAPVGALRFQPPVPAKPWDGVRAADQPGAMCLQRNVFSQSELLEGSEDCLFINVYAPQSVTRATPLAVMVFIHGGGFMSGSGNLYGPELILERDVIYVSFNYRLGPLGFLSNGDSTLPGNYGMKDMVLALKWVRDNIHAFGGDHNQVTIFGESAGAASVSALMLSPLSKGLFQRAAAMSGSTLAPWAFYNTEQARERARVLAEATNCPASPSTALRDCLLTKSAEDITTTDVAFTKWQMHPLVPFRIVTEPSGPDAFLDKNPAELLAQGEASDVPFLTGIVSHEGSIVVVPFLEDPKVAAEFDERHDELASIVLFSDHLPKDVNRRVYQKLRAFYFGDKAIGNETRWELIDYMTDGLFAYSGLKAAKLHAKSSASPVFFYELAHKSERSFAVIFGAKAANYGVCHADDLLYLFPLTPVPPQPSAADQAFSSQFVDLFVTFAITGAPTVDGSWRAIREGPLEYAYLAEAGAVTMRQDFAPERMALWDRLPAGVGLAVPTVVKDEL